MGVLFYGQFLYMGSPGELYEILKISQRLAGYGGVGGVNYRLPNGSNGELGPTASRLKSQTSLSSGIPSSLGMLSRISEFDGGNIAPNGNENAKNGTINGETQYYASEYPLSSWNDSLHFAENYSGLKRELDADDDRLFSSSQVVFHAQMSYNYICA